MYPPCSTIIISAVNYRDTFSPKLDLTINPGILTYGALQQMQLELKTNAPSVHSNLVGATHGHIAPLMTNTTYTKLSNVPHVRPVYPSILLITKHVRHVASYKLEQVYDEDLRVFHEVCGFKQALIQQVVTTVDEQYIISMKNRATANL